MSVITVNIAGTNRSIIAESLTIPDRIEERSRCSFTIQLASAITLSFGQQISASDSVLGLLFTGVINTWECERIHPQDLLEYSVDCVDCIFYVDSVTANEAYSDTYAGVIVADQHSKNLAAQGITAAYALRTDTSQSDFAAGTLSGTTATTTESGDGVLELALAGSAVNSTLTYNNGLLGTTSSTTALPTSGYITLASFNAIQYKADCTIANTAAYLYTKILDSSYVIASGDYITYDVWISKSSPKIKAAVDFVCTDGTTYRDSGNADAEYLNMHPDTDLTGLADNQWYNRYNFFAQTGSSFIGKTIKFFSLGFEGDDTGSYTAYFRRIKIMNGTTTKLTIFSDTTTSIQNPQPIGVSCYTNMQCSVVTAYEKSGTAGSSGVINIGAAGIYQSSLLHWDADVPDGCDVQLTASIDRVNPGDSAVYKLCTNNAPIPGLVPGLNISGLNSDIAIYLYNNNNDPLYTPTFKSLTAIVNPAYNATKTDYRFKAKLTADYTAGTLTNLIASSNVLQLNGVQQSFATPTIGTVTLFGSFGAGIQTENRALFVQSNTNNLGAADSKLRLDFAGNWQNFTLEIDVKPVSTSLIPGIVYRTTNWGNALDTAAYQLDIITNQIKLGRGTNSTGAGGYTQIATASVTLQTNTWYRIKLVVNGNTHTVFINDVQYINATDSTYTAAGGIGLKCYNNTGVNALQHVYFRNFGVAAATSGTWVSPAFDLSSVGTVLNSFTRTQGSGDYTQYNIATDISYDNGTTWQSCPQLLPAAQDNTVFNYSVTGLSPGTNTTSMTQVKLRLTLSVGSVAAHCETHGTILYVISSYSSSGTRIAPALSLAPAGRSGSTLVAWNADTPTGTTVAVETSPDGSTWTYVSNGGAIAGSISQPATVLDTFDVDSSASYTCYTFGSGTGTRIWDTTNSRLSWSGANNAVLRYDGLTIADCVAMADIDQADNAGIATRITASNTMYALYLYDSSATTFGLSNTWTLYKIVSGTFTQLATGNTGTGFTLARGTPHRITLSAIGTAISVIMDGTTLASVTDTAITAAGQSGLIGGALLRCYNLRLQGQGQNLTGVSAHTRTTLTSIDPTLTPQLQDLTIAALSPDIGIGALIPAADQSNRKVKDVIGDVEDTSNYYWNVRPDKSLVARARTADPAPWILIGNDTMIEEGPKVAENGDNYFNRMILTNVTDLIDFTQTLTGDGTAQSFALKYKLNTAPTVLLNGQPQAIGLKGTSGSDWYWEQGSETLTQDDSGTVLQQDVDFLTVSGQGQTTTTVTRDNTSMPNTTTQSQFQAIAGGTGIVTVIEDGKGMTVDAATTYADGQLQKFGKIGRTITFKTRRSGLKSGQYLSAIIPGMLLNDAVLLITSAQLTYWAGTDAKPIWEVEAAEGPNTGSWAKVIGDLLGQKKTRGLATSSIRSKKRVATTVYYLAPTALTSSSNSADLPVDAFLELSVDVNISAKSGTSPTIQFFVDRKGADGNYYPVWQSSSITAIGQVSTSIGAGMATAQGFGSTARFRWVVGGTTPSWTLSASIIGK